MLSDRWNAGSTQLELSVRFHLWVRTQVSSLWRDLISLRLLEPSHQPEEAK